MTWAEEYAKGRAEQVEQQRVANLLALANTPNVGTFWRDEATREAIRVLLPKHTNGASDEEGTR